MTRVSGEREQPVPPMDTTPAVGVFPEELWTLMPVIVEGGAPHESARPIQSGQDLPAPIASLLLLLHRSSRDGTIRSDCHLQ